MKLIRYRVTEYRSVWDSGPIQVGEVTCFVGKNEAGKTSLLQALSRLNPVIKEDSDFDVDLDYPRKDVGDYLHNVETEERNPAVVISAEFELSPEEIGLVVAIFGPKALRSTLLRLEKDYDNHRTFFLDFDEGAARQAVIEKAQLTEEAKVALTAAVDWKSLNIALAKLEDSAEVQRLKALVALTSKNGGNSYAYNNILGKLVPRFLYFDEYYQMKGHENIPALIQRRDANKLQPFDYPMLGLINLARITLEDLLNSQRTVELVNKLQGASNQLSKRILKYWSQNKHLQLKLDVREGRAQDPAHMRQGQNIWGRVYDEVHWADTELGARSKGFIWFFSFLAWYEDIKRGKENVILLLDEPGLSLHGRAQADFLRYIEEELKPSHQVIYTTHSPFMVDPHHFDRVRIVQDAGIDSDEELPRDQDGTKVLANIFDGSPDSLFPLQAALGYDIHQTLFVGPNTLVVEGAADLLYLQAMSSVLEREGRAGLSGEWTITPVGGSGKVPTFVAMLAPQKGMNVAVLMDFQKSDEANIEAIYQKKLLSKNKVLTYAQFTGGAEADVEDMFDRGLYLEMVSGEYKATLKAPITIANINENIPRVLKAIDVHLKDNPLSKGSFGHYRPARYFTENLQAISAKLSDETKDRFEAAFVALNKLLESGGV